MLLCWLGKVMAALVPAGTKVLFAAGRGSANAALSG